MRLAGKTALITDATRDIDLAFAKAYVAEGVKVTIADINLPRTQQAAKDRARPSYRRKKVEHALPYGRIRTLKT